VDIARGDVKLLRIVDRAVAEAASRAGAHLVCRPGCTPCCMGPFAIGAADAWRLGRGLADLAETDPGRARDVVERARRSWEQLASTFPGDAARGVLAGDEEAEEAFFAAFEREPCPALDPLAGTCDLYAARPAGCRTFGPPMRIGGDDLAPCALCFTTASPAEVERARATLDVGVLEDEMASELSRRGEGGDTIVAAVLARGVVSAGPADTDR
jgi:Fe-S-cluster containining protein